jgi:U3 small nucleolar RNA-associated protein 18
MNGSCQSSCFSDDERYLYTVGDQADIYQWDIRQRKCVDKIPDEGAFQTTKVAVSQDGKHLATGSKMGTVNIYSVEGSKIQEKPAKTVMSLTTAITDLKFGKTGQTLAYCSKWKKNAVRMVHIPSY